MCHKNHPYRSTASQYFPKKCSGGPQVPSDPPPCCRFSQSSADEGLLLSFLFMVSAAVRGRVDLWTRAVCLLIIRLLSPVRCGAVRCGGASRTSSSRSGKQHQGAPHRQEGQRGLSLTGTGAPPAGRNGEHDFCV